MLKTATAEHVTNSTIFCEGRRMKINKLHGVNSEIEKLKDLIDRTYKFVADTNPKLADEVIKELEGRIGTLREKARISKSRQLR